MAVLQLLEVYISSPCPLVRKKKNRLSVILNRSLHRQRQMPARDLLRDGTDIFLCWTLLDLLHRCAGNRARPAWSGSPQLRWEIHLSIIHWVLIGLTTAPAYCALTRG